MRKIHIFILLVLTLSACIPGAVPSNTPNPSPTVELVENLPSPVPTIKSEASPTAPIPTNAPATAIVTETSVPEQAKKSVFLISWDGAPSNLVYKLMEDGYLPHFSSLAEQGIRAESAQSVDPSLTSAAQNTIATGSYPSHTGIVSNSFHNPNDSIYWYRRGYDEALDQAEPVWVTASKQGLTTAAVFFLGGSPDLPSQMADYTIDYGIQDAYSNQFSLSLEPVSQAWEGALPESFSPPLEGSYAIPEINRVYFYAVDPSDDQQANYSRVYINIEKVIDENTPGLQVNDWGSLVLMPKLVAGAEFLLQEIDQDKTPLEITLYHTGIFHNLASPRELQDALNQKFGFFPSGADSYAMEDGWITAEQNLYLLKKASQWMAEVSAWVYQTYQPDLQYTWHDEFDAAGHAFLMQNERQYNYTPELAEQYQDYYRQAAQSSDNALATMLDVIDLEETTVMMVADHGMAPIHSVVYVNTILEKAGLLALDGRDYVIEEKTKAIAIASGGAAHIYINLLGHEKDGFVPESDYTSIQQQIIDLFENLVDPESGGKVFQHVLRQDELAEIHLDHINSGDVFVQAFPGYHLDGWRGNAYIFELAVFYGQHGYDSRLPEMQAIFIAAGGAMPAQGIIIPAVKLVDYAPTIAHLLGFMPAPTVDGEIIPAFAQLP